MDISAMAYSDKDVYQALQALLSERGDKAILTHNEISRKAETSYRTTRRALYRLEIQGMITRERLDDSYYRYSIPRAAVTR